MRTQIDNGIEKIVEPNLDSLQNWWQFMINQIYAQDRLIRAVQVDGKLLYDGYEQYIRNNIDRIEEIKIQTLTRSESLFETKQTLDEYLERFIPISSELSRTFFGDLTQEHWQTFSDFITGLDWIISALKFAELLSQNDVVTPQQNYGQMINELQNVISEMEKSLEDEDYVTVGDLIQHELLPVLEKCKSQSH